MLMCLDEANSVHINDQMLYSSVWSGFTLFAEVGLFLYSGLIWILWKYEYHTQYIHLYSGKIIKKKNQN